MIKTFRQFTDPLSEAKLYYNGNFEILHNISGPIAGRALSRYSWNEGRCCFTKDDGFYMWDGGVGTLLHYDFIDFMGLNKEADKKIYTGYVTPHGVASHAISPESCQILEGHRVDLWVHIFARGGQFDRIKDGEFNGFDFLGKVLK